VSERGDQVEGPDRADREHDEDEIWRDIVSRFDQPPEDEEDGEAAPWPAEESLTTHSFGVRVIKPGDPDATPAAQDVTAAEPDAIPAEEEALEPGADEHYVPPPPPALPRLDPVTKGAWLALFGGPGYLLVATVAGWTIPSWVAFCAVAAFVGGFVTLVLRMSDDGQGDSGPDDGAAV